MHSWQFPARTAQDETSPGVVCSHNEWDPLEEVIVGRLEGAVCLSWSLGLQPFADYRPRADRYGGLPRSQADPPGSVAAAQADLDGFVQLLESMGVRVRRPEAIDHARPVATPDWAVAGGYGQSVPRDVMIVIGDEIIESPMSLPSRFFEYVAYRELCKEYFRAGARWTQAPKPRLRPDLFKPDYKHGKEFILTESEPVWDAADVCRIGTDLFVQLSQVTNNFGIDWLERHAGPRYRVHRVQFRDAKAMHIDATFVPLAPGKLLVNPDRPILELPECIAKSGWEIRECPRSAQRSALLAGFEWLHMNILSLDENHVIVEEGEEPLQALLRDWGIEPIPCRFRNFYPFGGSFHCATVDIRRRGDLHSYF
jgi:glycine amidinotransferase